MEGNIYLFPSPFFIPYLSNNQLVYTLITLKISIDITAKNYRINNSQGLIPVCFLNAVEKCEIDE